MSHSSTGMTWEWTGEFVVGSASQILYGAGTPQHKATAVERTVSSGPSRMMQREQALALAGPGTQARQTGDGNKGKLGSILILPCTDPTGLGLLTRRGARLQALSHLCVSMEQQHVAA